MSVPAPSLQDPGLEATLADQGYVVIEGLLDADAVARLRDWYRRVHPEDPEAEVRSPAAADLDPVDWDQQTWPGSYFLTGVDEIGGTDRDRMEDELAPLWEEAIAPHLVDHEALISSFLMKWPGTDGVMPLHQDPTITDEREHRSVTVWIALDDATEDLDNGPLRFVPESHRHGCEQRGTGTVPSYFGELERVWSASVPVDVRAGDAIVMDGRVVHGSAPNRSGSPRLAVAVVCVPRDVQLVHAIRDGEGADVRLVAVERDFYRTRSPRSIHAAPPLDHETVAVRPAVERPLDLDEVAPLDPAVVAAEEAAAAAAAARVAAEAAADAAAAAQAAADAATPAPAPPPLWRRMRSRLGRLKRKVLAG